MARSFHGHALRKGRLSIQKQIYLVTAVTYRRYPVFECLQAGRHVVRELIESENRQRATTLAFVVMPDHLHWMMSLAGNESLSCVVAAVKRYSAIGINKLHECHGTQVWQRGFHEHALRSEESLRDVARYVITNPLRAGLVQRIGDYPLWDAFWV